MSSEYLDTALVQIRDVIHRLQRPIPDFSTLIVLLSSPLDCLGLLPPQFRGHNTEPLPDGAVIATKHIPTIQRALLEHVAPTWDVVLEEKLAMSLLEQYFCPDSFSYASQAAGDVVLLAYSTILSQPLTGFGINMLARLAKEYPLDRLHAAVFGIKRDQESNRMVQWEDCVRNVTVVPGKVANALTGKEVPPELEHGTYFNSLCTRCECLIASLAIQQGKGLDKHCYAGTPLLTHTRYGTINSISYSQTRQSRRLSCYATGFTIAALVLPNQSRYHTCSA